MSKSNLGSCMCGLVTVSCGKALGLGVYCHCTDCQKSSGSAFGVSIPFAVETFYVLSGELGSFTKLADSGNELTRYFCSNCGSPIYGTSPQHPGRVYVKAGILNVSGLVRPTHESWCQSKVSWSKIEPELPSFQKSSSLA